MEGEGEFSFLDFCFILAIHWLDEAHPYWGARSLLNLPINHPWRKQRAGSVFPRWALSLFSPWNFPPPNACLESLPRVSVGWNPLLQKRWINCPCVNSHVGSFLHFHRKKNERKGTKQHQKDCFCLALGGFMVVLSSVFLIKYYILIMKAEIWKVHDFNWSPWNDMSMAPGSHMTVFQV